MQLALSACILLIGVSALWAQSGPRQHVPRPSNLTPVPASAAVRADGFIYASGTLSEKGGDIRAQTRAVLDDLQATLGKAGSSLAHAVSVTIYLRRAGDFAAVNEVYRTYWPKDPPVRTTVLAEPVLPQADVYMSAIAVPDGGDRRIVHPQGWMPSPNPYSYAIQSGDTLFLSGLISRNGRDNSVVPGDITTQTKTVLDNGGEILKAAGFGYEHVVSSRVYVTDPANFQPMNAAYRGYFAADPPTRATVITGLTAPDYLVEITMVAVKGSKTVFTTPNADGAPGQKNPVLSSAIRVGNRLWLSGMLGNTPANTGQMAAQARETLGRITRTMKAAGFEPGEAVDGVIYLTDVGGYAAMNTAYRDTFPKDFPARATIKTGLVAPEGMVEMMFLAVK